MNSDAPTVVVDTPDERRQHLLAALAAAPILLSVYQTLVLTDVTGDVIRKAIEADSNEMLWTTASFGAAVLLGVFAGLAGTAQQGARMTICAGLFMFALGNFLCGAATDVSTLSIAKLVEGIGKGIVIVICRATLYQQFGAGVVWAIGFYGIAAYATRPTTPLFTAIVNDELSWRWIFWVNIPLALLGLILVLLFFRPDRPAKAPHKKADIVSVLMLLAWIETLVFCFGWYRKWGGWASNEFTLVALTAIILPVLLLIRVAGGAHPNEHLVRMLRIRGYLVAMSTRTLLLVNLLAVLTLMATYMIQLRDYPRATTGWVLAPASLTMAVTTALTTLFHRRSLRPMWLAIGALGSSYCVWWMASVDNFTSKEHLALMFAVWGACLGLLPPVFLADEVEVLDPRDKAYAGVLALICLILPLILVPTITQTVLSEWTDRAFDAQRQNLQDHRPIVQDVVKSIAEDYHRRGQTPAESQQSAGVVLGAAVKLQSTALGIEHGLRFLAVITGMIGLVLSLLRWTAPSPVVKPVTN